MHVLMNPVMTLSDTMDPSVIATKLEQVGLATPIGISSGKKREVIFSCAEAVSMLEKVLE